MNSQKFRKELVKIMPGYSWTVHRSHRKDELSATGIVSAGLNRISTLAITRRERADIVIYTASSAGFGKRAPWLHINIDTTLARALRGLQDYYKLEARKFRLHEADLQNGRGV